MRQSSWFHGITCLNMLLLCSSFVACLPDLSKSIFWTCMPRSVGLLTSTALQGVTTCLFPLTVVKTRQMAIQGAPTGLWVSSKSTLRSQSPLDQQTCFTLCMCTFCMSILYLHANRSKQLIQCVMVCRVLRRQPGLY